MKLRRILSLLLALCLTASLPVSACAAQLTGDPAVSADTTGSPGDTGAADNAGVTEGTGGAEDPDAVKSPESPGGAADQETPESPDAAEGQEGASLLEENSGEPGGGEADLTLPQQENWSFTIETGADEFHYDYTSGTMTVNGAAVPDGGTGTWTGAEGGVTVRVHGTGDEWPDMVLHEGASLSKLHIHLENMPRFAVNLDGTSTINYTPDGAQSGDGADRAPALWFTTGQRSADIAILPGADDSADATGALTIHSAGQSIRLDGEGSVLRLEGSVAVDADYTGASTADRTEENIWDGDFFNQATQFGGVRIFGDLQVTGGARLNVCAYYLPLDVYGVLAANGGNTVVTARARTEEVCRETINACRLECSEGASIQALPQEGAQTPAQISLRGDSVIVGENSVVEAQSLTVDAGLQGNEDGTVTKITPAKLDVEGGGQLIVHPTAMGVEAVRDGNDQPMEGRACVLAAPGLSINGGSAVEVHDGGCILAHNWIDRTDGSYTEGCINAIDLRSDAYNGQTAQQPTTLRVGPNGRVDVCVELGLGRGVQLWNDAQVLLEGGSMNLRLQKPDAWGMCLGKDEGSEVSPTLAIHSNWLNIWDEYPYTKPEDMELQPAPYAGGLSIEQGTVTVDAGWGADDPNRPADPVNQYPGGISIDVAAPFALNVAEGSVLDLCAGEVSVNGRCEYIYIPGAVEVNGTVNMTGGILRANGVRRGLVIEGGGTARFNVSGGEVIAAVAEGDQAVSWCPGALVRTGGVAAWDGERNPVDFQQRDPNEGETEAEPLCWYPLSYVRITNHPEYSADDNNLGPEDRWLKLSIFDRSGTQWVWECRNGHVADWRGNPLEKNAYAAPPAGVALDWYDAAQADGTVSSADPPVLTLTGIALKQIMIEAENVGSVTLNLEGASTLSGGAQPGMPALTLNGGVDYILNSSAAGGGTLTISTDRQAVSASLYGLWGQSGSLTVDGVTLDLGYPRDKTPAEDEIHGAYGTNHSRLGGMWVGGGDLTVKHGGKLIANAYGAPLSAENCTVTGEGSAVDVTMRHIANEPDFFALDVNRLEILNGGSVRVDAFGGLQAPVSGEPPVSVLIRGGGSRVENGTLNAETLHIHGIFDMDSETVRDPGHLTIGPGGQVNLTPVLLQRTWEDENNGTVQAWAGIHGVMLFEGSTLEIAGGALTLTEDVPASVSGMEDGFNTGINSAQPGCAVDMSAGTLNITMSGGSYNNGIRLAPGSVLRQTGGEITIVSNGPAVEAEGSTVSLTGGALTGETRGAANSAFVLLGGRVTEDGQNVGSELDVGVTANVTLTTGKGTVDAAPALLVGDGGACSMLLVRGGALTAEGGQGVYVEANSQAWFQGGTVTAKGRFRTKVGNPEKPEQFNELSHYDWEDPKTYVGDPIAGQGEIHLGVGVFAKDGQGYAAQPEAGGGWHFFAPVYLDTGYTRDSEGYNCGTMTAVLSGEAGTAPYSEALEITSGPVTAGVPFTVRAVYTGVTGNVTFTLPQGVTYRANSLTVDAQAANPTVKGNTLTVALTEGGTVRFSAVAGDAGSWEIATLTAVSGAQPGSLAFQAGPMTLELPSATARKTITVSGVAAEGTMVIYEVSGSTRVELGRVAVSALGAWRTALDLSKVVDSTEKELQLQGVLLDEQGNLIASTQTVTLRYRPSNVEVRSLTITNEVHGAVPGETVTNTVAADFINNTRTPSYLTYWPELPVLHFSVEFSDAQAVSQAWVVTTGRQGNEQRIKLVLTEDGGSKWVDENGHIPDSQLFPELYRVEWLTVTAGADPAEEEMEHSPNVRIPVSRDPSGYVYEGIPSNRLTGVTTTLYFSETKPTGNATEAMKWDAAAFDQQNPLTTDLLGQYQWMVPDGWWQVKYEKAGYNTVWSQWLPVPPVQTEVNVEMTRTDAAKLTAVTLENRRLMLVFDRPVSVSQGAVQVSDFLGEPLEGILLPVDPETRTTARSGEYYARAFYYNLNEVPPAGRALTVESTLATYNGTQGKVSGTVKVAGTAEPVYGFSCRRDGSAVVVTARVETAPSEDFRLVVAVYDGQGRQLAVRTASGVTGLAEHTCRLNLPAGAATVKAFALREEGYAPFGNSAQWEVPALQAQG